MIDSKKRTLITSESQERAVALMMKFRKLHVEIDSIQSEIEKLQVKKDAMIAELESARADDTMLQTDLESRYGPGRLDGKTLEWINE